MDDLEVVNPVENSTTETNRDNGEGKDFFEDEAQSDRDETGEKWIDVKELKKMSLNELKTLSVDNCKSDADRRLDLPITKVVVRRLPPQITVQDYLQELSEVPNHNYIRLVPPNEDLPSRIGRRSSIYINFDTEQEAFWFKEKYNNMKFFDERGNSYISCVDFSFIQDIAQDPPDEAQVGTLEDSEMFQTFLKAYEEEPWSFTMNRPDNIPTPEAMLDEILNKKIIEPDSTPLLQYLRERSQKKEAARKEREQRRKEKDIVRRKQKDEIIKRRQKEKEEAAARRKQKEKEESMKRKSLESEPQSTKDREKDNQRDRRRERDRERQRERDRERRLRREREKLEREKEQTNKNGEDQQDKMGQTGKESSRQKNDKDSKQKSFSGTVTYSRSGNPTRWSENSGPRKSDKLDKDDHKRSQEQLSQVKQSSSSLDKLPVEKAACDNSSNPKTKDISTKSSFGKPFPTKSETAEDNDKKEGGSGDSNGNKTKARDDGPDSYKKEPNANGGAVKKRIVKRVIKVKKVKDNGGGGTENLEDVANNGQQSGSSEAKPKKIIRVVKKSSKSEESSGSKLVAESVNKKVDADSKNESKGDTSDHGKGDTEKDRKGKKGRPEIQIYRPGSLRGGASKSTSSSGDKERKSDNNNL